MFNQCYDTPAKLEARKQEMLAEDVKPLLEKAEKGNWAWNLLETKYGLDGDWTPYDLGMEKI